MDMIEFRLAMEDVYSNAATFMDTLLGLPDYSERERHYLLCTDPRCMTVTVSAHASGRCRNCGHSAISKEFFQRTGLETLPGYLFDGMWSNEDGSDYEHDEILNRRAGDLSRLDDLRQAIGQSNGNDNPEVLVPGTNYIGFKIEGASLSAPKKHFIKARSNKDMLSHYIGSGSIYVPNMENAPVFLLPPGALNLREQEMRTFLDMLSRLRAGEALDERHYNMLREEYRSEHWEVTGRAGFLKALFDRGLISGLDSFINDDAKAEFIDVLYNRTAAGNGIVPAIRKNGIVDFKYDRVVNSIDWAKARKRWAKLCGECNPFPFNVPAE